MAVKLFLCTAIQDGGVVMALRDTSDLSALGLILGLTTAVDIRTDTRLAMWHPLLHHWVGTLMIGIVAASAAAFALQESAAQLAAHDRLAPGLLRLREMMLPASIVIVTAAALIGITAEFLMHGRRDGE
ncbi:MAG TPA: hypothetical protein VHI13_15850 [Candidatus Kapabacteria bacterium]|nr:hypothetical protein [Candidatus Kapabacteria bacterium]